MHYIRQFGIILLISLVGELLGMVIPLPVPASIYVLVLLFLALQLRLLPLEEVRDAAHFLIEIMPLMFIPAAVGLMSSWGVLRANLAAYLVITLVSTLLVMLAAGRVTQRCLRRGRKQKRKEASCHDAA